MSWEAASTCANKRFILLFGRLEAADMRTSSIGGSDSQSRQEIREGSCLSTRQVPLSSAISYCAWSVSKGS